VNEVPAAREREEKKEIARRAGGGEDKRRLWRPSQGCIRKKIKRGGSSGEGLSLTIIIFTTGKRGGKVQRQVIRAEHRRKRKGETLQEAPERGGIRNNCFSIE